ncbi:MAG: hypothetical protein OXC95_01305, partial [Dehalococcoidia bacterium]|nr:hypothetical protein [Dehalococcoidia bacterium]
ELAEIIRAARRIEQRGALDAAEVDGLLVALRRIQTRGYADPNEPTIQFVPPTEGVGRTPKVNVVNGKVRAVKVVR